MRLTGFSIVKNESDIIESFVRFNLAVLDELWIVDNGSTDTTSEILQRLGKEYPQLKLHWDKYLDHRQEVKLRELIIEAGKTGGFDFAVLLDADEFMVCDGRIALESSLSALPPQVCGAIPWVTYVPRADDDWSEPDVLRRIRHRRAAEPQTLQKVVLPAAVAQLDGLWISAGSHSVLVQNGKIPMQTLEGVSFAHFPVRSPEQLASKVLIGEWSLSLKAWRVASEGHHWRELASKIHTSGVFSRAELESVAAGYSIGERAVPLVEDSIAVSDRQRMRYPELVQVDVVRRLAAFGNQYFGWVSRTVYATDSLSIGRTRLGPLAYLRADTVIGRSINMYGEWGFEELALLLPLLRSGDAVLDVGANIGTHSVPFAHAVGPTGRVYAFEPQRTVYQVLCANAALNGLSNIYAMHAGVSDHDGVVRVRNSDLVTGGNLGNYHLADAEDGEPVAVVQIDRIAFPVVRLLKIDVEGMESKVLLGARQLISRDRPLLFVENNQHERSGELLRLIESLRYRSYWHFADYYNPANFYGNMSNCFAGADRPEINLLCMPTEDGLVPDGLVPVRSVDETWQEAYVRLRQAVGAMS